MTHDFLWAKRADSTMIARMVNKANSSWVIGSLLGTIAVVLFLIPAVPAASEGSKAVMEFVPIPVGEFMMGCPADERTCYPSEKPAHLVKITKPFELGKYEVTQAQWKAVHGGKPSLFSGPDRPVEMVSWNDVQGFLSKMNQQRDGYHYRLPTEAEWEYAARAGSALNVEPGDAAGWFGRNAGGQTHDVGQKQPNAWGLYDMGGNVAEWVADWYGDYTSEAVSDPEGPVKGQAKVLRGSSWIYSDYPRVSIRFFNVPTLKYNDTGFRCARERIKQ